MTTREDIEAWFDRLDWPVEPIAEDIWLIRAPDGPELAVNFAPPVLVIRTRVMPLPDDKAKSAELCRRLLELNAHDLVHGSYGLEGDTVVLSDALELTDLNFSEFEASVDSLTVALASHASSLATFGEG